MLGPLTRRLFFEGYKWGTYLCYLPYWWDPKTKQLHDSAPKPRLYCYRFCACANWIAPVWLLVRAVQTHQQQDGSEVQLAYKFICIGFLFASILPVSFHYNVIRARHELPLLNFQYINLITKFQEKYVIPLESESRREAMLKDTAGIILHFCFYLTIAAQVMFVTVPLLVPDLPVLLTSLTIVRESLPTVMFSALVVIQWLVIVWYITSMVGMLYIYIPAIDMLFSTVEICNEMTLGRPSYTTRESLRSDAELLRMYKELLVLYRLIIYVISPVILPAHKWLFLFLSVVCIYISFRVTGFFFYIDVVCVAALLSYLGVVFSMLSKMPVTSEEMLRSWAGRSHSLWVDKNIRSLKPIQMPIGGCYFVDKGMVLTMFRFILESTVDLICL